MSIFKPSKSQVIQATARHLIALTEADSWKGLRKLYTYTEYICKVAYSLEMGDMAKEVYKVYSKAMLRVATLEFNARAEESAKSVGMFVAPLIDNPLHFDNSNPRAHRTTPCIDVILDTGHLPVSSRFRSRAEQDILYASKGILYGTHEIVRDVKA